MKSHFAAIARWLLAVVLTKHCGLKSGNNMTLTIEVQTSRYYHCKREGSVYDVVQRSFVKLSCKGKHEILSVYITTRSEY